MSDTADADKSVEDGADLQVTEIVTSTVDEDGNVVVDDLITAVDAEGHVVATDETVAIETPDGDIVVDETFSVAGEDGELHAIEEDVTVLEAERGSD
ncbi:MAG: hypothetical protein ACHQNA_00175 [Acidimicrobiales bacterium]